MNKKQEVWYAHGLRFGCVNCGKCCSGAPGYVWVTPKEIEKMAWDLGISKVDFELKFVRAVGNKLSIREHSNGDCVFLDRDTRKCMLYNSRPTQCRTWPFWDENLQSRQAWRQTARSCKGCDTLDGRLYSFEEIEENRKQKV